MPWQKRRSTTFALEQYSWAPKLRLRNYRKRCGNTGTPNPGHNSGSRCWNSALERRPATNSGARSWFCFLQWPLSSCAASEACKCPFYVHYLLISSTNSSAPCTVDTGSGSSLHAGILLYLSSSLTLFNDSLTAQGNLMTGAFIHDVSTQQRRAWGSSYPEMNKSNLLHVKPPGPRDITTAETED